MATVEQIHQELKAWNEEQGEYYEVGNALSDELWEYGTKSTKSIEIPSGTVTLVENVGGGEGDGEERYIVVKVGEQYFQYRGYYSSWSGTEWDDRLREVEPFEVTVTKYRVKKEN